MSRDVRPVAARRRLVGAAIFVLGLEQAGFFGEGAAEGGGVRLCLGELSVEHIELLLRVAQLALDGEGAFRARLAAGDGDVVEALAGGREEEGARIFERERARFLPRRARDASTFSDRSSLQRASTRSRNATSA